MKALPCGCVYTFGGLFLLVDSVGELRGVLFLMNSALVGALEGGKAAKSAHLGKLAQRFVLVAGIDLH